MIHPKTKLYKLRREKQKTYTYFINFRKIEMNLYEMVCINKLSKRYIPALSILTKHILI